MKHGLRVLTVAMVMLALAAAGASAKSSGLRLGLEFGNPHAVLIIRPAPLDFKVGYNFAAPKYLYFSVDYRIIDRYRIVDILNFFLGVGAYTSIAFEPTDFDLGAHLPLGLQVFLIDNVVELFLEAAPAIGFFPSPHWAGVQGYIGFTILVKS
jgi:hypothetical protein